LASFKIDAAELLKEINSAGLGQVIDARTLRRHREQWELGKSIDVGTYAAHLVDRYQAKQAKSITYEDKKDKARQRSEEQTRKGQDIGALPDIFDPDRREACRYDLRLFFDTYIAPEDFFAWSPDHLDIFATMQDAILNGGNFALAMPRGSGKTTITEAAALWALLFGHVKFVVIVGATGEKAVDLLETIKTYLVAKEKLVEDFPEACVPIMKLEGQPGRCRGQRCQGKRTQIGWHEDELIFPTIEGSACSGSIIRTFGITAKGIRGQKYTNAEGVTFRPDLVLLDDPQDDESAASPGQVKKREKTINGTIGRLGGPGKPVTLIMPCTVIEPDDLASRYLDRKRYPRWSGKLVQMMKSFPANEAIWEEYFTILREDLAAGKKNTRANAFYKKNRKEMDRGAEVYWVHRWDPGEISAIQHAMHIRDDDPETFAAEYQNDPISAGTVDLVIVTADEIAAKVHSYGRDQLPIDTDIVVGYVDLQLRILYYALGAMRWDFTGHIHNYGTWPKQPTKYFIYSPQIAAPIQGHRTEEGIRLGTLSEEAQIRQALEILINQDLMLRTWKREGDGAEFQIDLLLIDMGDWTHIVKQFIAESPHRARLMPNKGRGVGAKNSKISETAKKPGEEIGEEWIIPRAKGKDPLRHIIHDTNHWKSAVQKRWKSPIGEPGCLTLYNAKPHEHRMISEHCAAEFANRMKNENSGNTVDEWSLKPNRDNHLLDCVAGLHVAASRKGCAVPSAELMKAKPKRKRGGSGKKKMSELRRERQMGR